MYVCVNVVGIPFDYRLENTTLSHIFYLEELHHFSSMIQSCSDSFLGAFFPLTLSSPRWGRCKYYVNGANILF